MSLENYRVDMESCCKCSICRFVPMEQIKGYEHANVCPSVSRFNFNAYSAGGRLAMGVAKLEKRFEYDEKLLEVIYNCQVCGACDVACKYANDMDVIDPINEIRIRCVDEGQTLPALDKTIMSLEKQATMIPGARANRGNWAEGLDVRDYTKESTEVVFQAGCRTCFDKSLWKVARSTINLLKKAGVNIGIGAENEPCCGGRAYHMGYEKVFLKQAKQNADLFKKSGVKTLVTGCSECYHAFKVLYDKFDIKGDLEVLHTSEYFAHLIKEGKLKPTKEVNMTVTYHDPCHLGRLGEPYIHWKGKELPGPSRLFDPPREFMRGTYGVYEPPREVLRSIPGLKLVEMARIKEYAWCCGAGGGVRESNPEFADWTAKERVREAQTTGADALISACPGCEQGFASVTKKGGDSIMVYDIAELLDKAVE
jgi:Fe-S oxidoreductase